MKVNEVIVERRMADLYHYTSVDTILKILQSGKMIPATKNWSGLTSTEFVSTTRDKSYMVGTIGPPARIILDQTKITNRLKIEPYDWAMDPKSPDAGPEYRRHESEERIRGSVPINCIKQVDLPVEYDPEGIKSSLLRFDDDDEEDPLAAEIVNGYRERLRLVDEIIKLATINNIIVDFDPTLEKD